jgi:hypothetical protein
VIPGCVVRFGASGIIALQTLAELGYMHCKRLPAVLPFGGRADEDLLTAITPRVGIDLLRPQLADIPGVAGRLLRFTGEAYQSV